EQSNDLPSRASAIHKLGEIYLSCQQPTKAHENFLTARDLYSQIGEQKGQLTTLVSLGHFFLDSKKYEEALRFTEEGYELACKLGHHELKIQSSVLLADILQKVNAPQRALSILFAARPQMQELSSGTGIKIYQSLASLYELNGDIENALRYQKRYAEALE